MGQPTAKYELIQIRLGRDLAAYVNAARDEGREWRLIASDLSTVTGIKVSHEALRQWFGGARAEVAS